jgi:toxin ParE1/3/4
VTGRISISPSLSSRLISAMASSVKPKRYYAAVERTCARLAQQPLSGTPYDSGTVRLKGMRRAPVSGFTAYLLFYVPRVGGIDVVRVLHGAQDIEHLFADEEP